MKVEFSKKLRRRMMKNLFFAGRREIGGLLMAQQIEPGWFRIEDFSIDKRTGTHDRFVMKPENHNATIDSFFDKTSQEYERYNYLGEWHSHPSFEPYPSAQDYHSMQTMLLEEANISFAVLLIVKLSYLHRLDFSATLFQQDQQPLEIEIVRN